jgi:hypothetical protein
MENPKVDLMDADLRIAWKRFGGKATAAQLLSWVNHHLRRGYQLQALEERLARLSSNLEAGSSSNGILPRNEMS